ncbi:MAG TPA: site-specific DNA-methyltransferase [Jiangellaceae bacterium]|nr:site-specific DNA-methyltransferase [Jiangellaceae bacterium]
MRDGRWGVVNAPYYTDDTVTLYRAEALAVLCDLPTGSVDAVVTDPPYSSGGQYRGDRAQPTGNKYSSAYETGQDFSGDNRDQRSYLLWVNLWLGECLRAVRPGGVCVLFTDWRQLPITTDALQISGWVWRGVVPWVKPSSRPQPGGFTASCEYVVWGSSGPLERDYTNGIYLPGFFQAMSPRVREHQTQKPLNVMRGLVAICPEGGTVLDPFMGSGTTGVAAVIEGRRFIGIEQIEHHAKIAERRIREAQGHAVPRGRQLALGEVPV